MIVQLVPPGPGGVRDHAERLRAAWAAAGRASRVVDSAGNGSPQPLHVQLQALRPTALLVHYSGYGYHPRGLCSALLDELHALRQAPAAPRLVTCFHELYAQREPPWRSAFWLAPWQARLAAQLARASDAVLTNTERHARWLRRHAAVQPPQPVFSNVGEPVMPAPFIERRPQLVVFGSESTRRRALRRLPRHGVALQAAGVREVVEVGHGASVTGPALPWPHRFVGTLPAEGLSALLGMAAWALLAYPSDLLAKSGVYAACAAHGCAVFNTGPWRGDADGLRHGYHYRALDRDAPAPAAAGSMAEANRRWYAGHRLALQAQALWLLLVR